MCCSLACAGAYGYLGDAYEKLGNETKAAPLRAQSEAIMKALDS